MAKALIIENILRDAERLSNILSKEALDTEVCHSGGEAQVLLNRPNSSFAIAFISTEIPGPPSAMELIIECARTNPKMPVVVISGALQAGLAARAAALGAKDFLERPLDNTRLHFCVEELLKETDPLFPMVQKLRGANLGENGEKLVGESAAFLETLRQVAKLIPHQDTRVLILGESGTGKELVARAIHALGPRASRPWVAVNIGETPSTLVESALFGHEKGAFTDARELHRGLLETAKDGTLFLDEIGDLELPLQVKLLRVIQEREFRRLKGSVPIRFEARLICATNRDLAHAVQTGTFRRDLYHRIAEMVVHVPPLRERHGDIDLLLDHFLQVYQGANPSRKLARETLTILRSYLFPGNIRELQNVIKAALIQSDGPVVLPNHLPLATMGQFLDPVKTATEATERNGVHPALENLFAALQVSVPENWTELPYKEAIRLMEQAFDRVYLQRRLDQARHNITKAAISANLDTKTFRKHWKECGLLPLTDEEQAD